MEVRKLKTKLRNLIVIVSCLLSFPEKILVAQTSTIPSAQDWAQEFQLQWQGQHRGFPFPLQVMIVEKATQDGAQEPKDNAWVYRAADIDATKLAMKTFIGAPKSRDFSWDLSINSSAEQDLRDLVFVQEVSGLRALIYFDGAGIPILRLRPNLRTVDGQIEVQLNKPVNNDHAEIIGSILPKLGFDGVVLAAKEKYLLVGASANILTTKNQQALAVNDSAGKFTLQGASKEGAGLLSLVDQHGGYGVFEIVLLGRNQKKIDVGTKLLIEKRQIGKKN